MTKRDQHAFDAEVVNDRFFQALIENAFDTIAILDADGAFSYVSPSIEGMMGWRPDELVGRHSFELIPPDRHAWAQDLLLKVVDKEGSTERFEVEARHKNGSWRLLDNVAQNLLHDPAIGGIVMNYRDITERRRWENALRESEERHEKAFSSSPDGIAISRLKDGVFLDVNAGFEEITGFPREELIGRSSLDLNHWTDPEDRDRLTEELRATGRVQRFQARFLDKQGEVHVGQLSAELFDLNGETCMLTTNRDVTEQTLAEEKLEQISAMLQEEHTLLLEKNEALSELLDRIQKDKRSYRHELSSSIENLLRPLLSKLGSNGGRLDLEDIDLLEQRVEMIGCREVTGANENFARLTPRERDVCGLIQQGFSSRDIAQSLGLSHETVNKHRQSIRRKLQIDHRGINLASYLRSR